VKDIRIHVSERLQNAEETGQDNFWPDVSSFKLVGNLFGFIQTKLGAKVGGHA
jgi:hypothetical protein